MLKNQSETKKWKKRKWWHHVVALSRSGSQLVSQKTTRVYSTVHSHARRGCWTHLSKEKKKKKKRQNLNAFSKCCWITARQVLHEFGDKPSDYWKWPKPRMWRFTGERIKTCVYRVCRRHHDKAIRTNCAFSRRLRRPATALLPWDQKKRKNVRLF